MLTPGELSVIVTTDLLAEPLDALSKAARYMYKGTWEVWGLKGKILFTEDVPGKWKHFVVDDLINAAAEVLREVE